MPPIVHQAGKLGVKLEQLTPSPATIAVSVSSRSSPEPVAPTSPCATDVTPSDLYNRKNDAVPELFAEVSVPSASAAFDPAAAAANAGVPKVSSARSTAPPRAASALAGTAPE